MREVVELAARFKTLILEDDAYGELSTPKGIVECRNRVLQRALGEFVVGNDQDPIGQATGNLVIPGQRTHKTRAAAACHSHDRL